MIVIVTIIVTIMTDSILWSLSSLVYESLCSLLLLLALAAAAVVVVVVVAAVLLVTLRLQLVHCTRFYRPNREHYKKSALLMPIHTNTEEEMAKLPKHMQPRVSLTCRSHFFFRVLNMRCLCFSNEYLQHESLAFSKTGMWMNV